MARNTAATRRSRVRLIIEMLTRRTTAVAGLVRRARIVLMTAAGVPLDRIACALGVQRNVVRTWLDRYRAGGLATLPDRPRSAGLRTSPLSPGCSQRLRV